MSLIDDIKWPGPPPAAYRDQRAVSMLEGAETDDDDDCEIDGADTPIDRATMVLVWGVITLLVWVWVFFLAPHQVAWWGGLVK